MDQVRMCVKQTSDTEWKIRGKQDGKTYVIATVFDGPGMDQAMGRSSLRIQPFGPGPVHDIIGQIMAYARSIPNLRLSNSIKAESDAAESPSGSGS